MLDLGAIGFLSPWVLALLTALPVIWWLLRVTPPSPVVRAFPPVRLLARLTGREESPAHTPWWILLLRLAAAAAVVVAGAQPVAQPDRVSTTQAPLVLVLDTGWTAGRSWPDIAEQADRLLAQADLRDRPVALIETAPTVAAEDAGDAPPALVSARNARTRLADLEPHPWPADRAAAARRLAALSADLAETGAAPEVIWLSDGLADPGVGDAALVDALRRGAADFGVYAPPPGGAAFEAVAPTRDGLAVRLIRPGAAAAGTAVVRAFAADGTVVARETLAFEAGARNAEADMTVPADLRNRIETLAIEGADTAAGLTLLDERWRRRAVGLIARPGDIEQPLTGPLYYLSRALEPFADVSRVAADDVLSRPASVIVAADPDHFAPEITNRIRAWIEGGGIFLRFAGPRLSSSIADGATEPPALVPHTLRPGDRAFGGALTWARAARLAPFDKTSPFFGLDIPDDVTVTRQVLTEPSIDVEANTWARLVDGTPLVTTRRQGDGWTVLVHVTANADWSNLPLSGLFVEMLERIVAMSAGVTQPPADARLVAERTIDGRGVVGPAAADALPIAADALDAWRAEPRYPPGLYAAAGFGRALNLRARPETFRSLGFADLGLDPQGYGAGAERDLRGLLLGLAAALFLIDLLLSLAHRGLLSGLRPARTMAAALAFALALGGGFVLLAGNPAWGQGADLTDDLAASLSPRIAYVSTGDARVDAIVEAGVRGLTTIVRRRTAAELGDPVAVDPEIDELVLYPLIYWPLTDSQRLPSQFGAEAVHRYLATGGMIVFDTRGAGGGGADTQTLRAMAEVLDLPPLVPVAQDHVLRRSFFLMRSFPGRWRDGAVWVDAQGATTNDGVASIVAGGNDWAAAWALDEHLRPMVAVVPGGERQREMAFRFGINLVMYALTGNYKEDQVHIPEILRRLGQ